MTDKIAIPVNGNTRKNPLQKARFIGAVLSGVLVLSSVTPAASQTPAGKTQHGGTAEVLFDEGVALADAGKIREACEKFEASERLEHATGTLLNLADCYEKTNRFASAWDAYHRVAVESKQNGKKERAEEARKKADELKPRISKISIRVAPEVAGIAGVVIKRNGDSVDRELWGQTVPVDSGEHTITAVAPGKTEWQKKIVVNEAESVTVEIPALTALGMPKQRKVAIAVGGVGLAGLIMGGVSGVIAVSKWHSALDACNGLSTNPTACKTQTNADKAAPLGKDAHQTATISTIGFALGGAGLAAAGILWFTASMNSASNAKTGWQLLPLVDRNGAGGVLTLRF